MQINIVKDKTAVGQAASMVIAHQILEKENCVLGFATGSSPLETYAELINLKNSGLIDVSKIRTFNLDEYVGLDKSHECSYYRFMRENLFDGLGLSEEQYSLPNGIASDLDAECQRYEDAINEAGGIDLQLLGIGHNGHIAFNEPDTYFSNMTHVVKLTESTINANTRFFDNSDDVPRTALSTGIGTIFKARNIVLIATGADKAEAVRDMVHGKIDPACPASILQLHKNVTVILDEGAASLL